MKGLLRAFRLEIKDIKRSKTHVFFLFFIPVAIITVLAIAGLGPCYYPPHEDKGLTYYDYFAPQIFSIAILFIATQLTVLRIVGERAPYGTLDRDLLAISRPGMFFGKFLANVLVCFCQCIMIFAVAVGIFHVKIFGDAPLVLVIIFSTALVGVSMGLLFSVVSRTRDQAIQLVPFSILILLVLNGSIIPLDRMPFGQIAASLPLTLSYNSLENVMLNGEGFYYVSGQIIGLLLWTAGLLTLGVVKFIVEKK